MELPINFWLPAHLTEKKMQTLNSLNKHQIQLQGEVSCIMCYQTGHKIQVKKNV